MTIFLFLFIITGYHYFEIEVTEDIINEDRVFPILALLPASLADVTKQDDHIIEDTKSNDVTILGQPVFMFSPASSSKSLYFETLEFIRYSSSDTY